MVALITSYPLFRLTLSLAAGILLADAFLCGKEIEVYVMAACLLLCSMRLFFLHRYNARWWFGLCVHLAFTALGGVLLLLAKQQVHYPWNKSDMLYVGRVQSVPQKHGSTYLATLHVEAQRDTTSSGWKAVEKDILLYYIPDSVNAPLQCGDRICFYGKVAFPLSDADVTGFDYGRYLECQGIAGTAVAFRGRWKRVGHAEGFSLRREALILREKVLERYRSWKLDADVQAVVSALTVGDKSELTRELKSTYSAAGASHVLALSGLHVGMLSVILSWMLFPLRWMRGGRWLISLLIVFALWGFAFLSGLSPSVVRAVTMFSLYVVASACSDSRFSGIFALSMAAFCMCVYQPLYLFDISFQLSFAAVCAILLFYPLIERLWHPRPIVWRYVWKMMVVSFSAQLGTAPLVLYYFGAFPTYFLLANLFVAPLAMFILIFALLGLAFSWIPVCGMWIVSALSGWVSVLNGLMEWICSLYGAQISSVYYSGWQSMLLAIALLALFGYCSARSVRSLVVSLLAFNVLAFSFMYERLHPEPPALCFTRGNVHVKSGRRLSTYTSPHGLLQIGKYSVALLNDERWKNRQSAMCLNIDYAYVCRGFRGAVSDIQRLFSVRCLLLDASLADSHRERLIKECKEKGQEYIDLSGKGFYSILL